MRIRGCEKMKFIKKNKYTLIVIVAFILIMIIGAKAMELFFPNTGKAVYGNRLDGIEEVRIKDSKMEQVLAEMKEDAAITDIDQETRGRLVSFIITVSDEVGLDVAKSFADRAIASFDDNQKAYYDFQVLIQKANKELLDFPIIGYRHHNNTVFVWTKDRAGA